MDSSASAEIAAIAAAISAALAFVVALANWRTATAEVKSADFDSCLTVVTRLADAQRRVQNAASEVERQFELRELLNLMEALALLENGNRIPPSTRKFTTHFLIEAWAFLRSEPAMKALMENSITGAETFVELLRFADRHSGIIAHLTKHYEQQRGAQTRDR